MSPVVWPERESPGEVQRSGRSKSRGARRPLFVILMGASRMTPRSGTQSRRLDLWCQIVEKKIKVRDLVGAQEIADRLGAARPQVVHAWRTRHPEFPQPVVHLSMGLLWEWPAVEKWARATGRLK